MKELSEIDGDIYNASIYLKEIIDSYKRIFISDGYVYNMLYEYDDNIESLWILSDLSHVKSYGNVTFVSETMFENLVKLCCLYEFSPKVYVLEYNSPYLKSVLNLINSYNIDKKEVFKLLFNGD